MDFDFNLDFLDELPVGPETWNLFIKYATRTLGVLALMTAAVFLARYTSKLVEKAAERAKIDPTLSRFSGKLVRWAVLILATIMALGTFGVRTASLAAVLASAGLAVGLAMQGTLAHFAAGVVLLIFRPLKVDDVVRVSGERGRVYEIGILFTKIDTFDNRRFIFPNGEILGSAIENIAYHSARRAQIAVGTDYDADLDRVREVLEEAAREVPGQAPDREPQVVLTGLGASTIDWEVRVWAERGDWLQVCQDTRRAVKRALDQAGISIPYSQLDVHFDPEAIAARIPGSGPDDGSDEAGADDAQHEAA